MTVEEFYLNIGGDYEDVLGRLRTEEVVRLFVRRFLSDRTYGELAAAVGNGDAWSGFKAAHKFRGLSAALGFTELSHAAGALADQLRTLDSEADRELMKGVTEAYRQVITNGTLLLEEGETDALLTK